MADYDKDMAEERIQIRDDKNKIFEDDKKKREEEGSTNKMLASNSPAKNQNKGYADSRELTDMPLTKDMTGGRGMSWMSKHATQRFSSPVKAHLSDAQESKLPTELQAAMHYNKDEKDGSMAKMVSPLKDQGYNARLDDALGGKHGHKSQPLVDRRHESEGMERHFGHHKFAGDKEMK
tara:strand:+ start:4328 stop:4861 length:534 start_codon:yes stop_codon:yes gene_type:complete